MEREKLVILIIFALIASTFLGFFIYNYLSIPKRPSNYIFANLSTATPSFGESMLQRNSLMDQNCTSSSENFGSGENVTIDCNDFRMIRSVNFTVGSTTNIFMFRRGSIDENINTIYREMFDGNFYNQINCTTTRIQTADNVTFTADNCSYPFYYVARFNITGNNSFTGKGRILFFSNSTDTLESAAKALYNYNINEYSFKNPPPVADKCNVQLFYYLKDIAAIFICNDIFELNVNVNTGSSAYQLRVDKLI